MKHTTVRVRPARASAMQGRYEPTGEERRSMIEVTVYGETIGIVKCDDGVCQVKWHHPKMKRAEVEAIVAPYVALIRAAQKAGVMPRD